MFTHLAREIQKVWKMKGRLEERWHQRKIQLDQCRSLHILESDISQSLEWISQHRQILLQNYTDIGHNYETAYALAQQHADLLDKCRGMNDQVSDLKARAHRLADLGHYDPDRLKASAARIDQEWRSVWTAVEDRNSVLTLSAGIHEKSGEYLQNVPNWLSEIENQGLPDEQGELEQACVRFDDLRDAFSSSYDHVSQTEALCYTEI